MSLQDHSLPSRILHYYDLLWCTFCCRRSVCPLCLLVFSSPTAFLFHCIWIIRVFLIWGPETCCQSNLMIFLCRSAETNASIAYSDLEGERLSRESRHSADSADEVTLSSDDNGYQGLGIGGLHGLGCWRLPLEAKPLTSAVISWLRSGMLLTCIHSLLSITTPTVTSDLELWTS